LILLLKNMLINSRYRWHAFSSKFG